MTVTRTGNLPGISIIKGETNQRACVIPVRLERGESVSGVVVNTGTNPRCYGGQTETLPMIYSVSIPLPAFAFV